MPLQVGIKSSLLPAKLLCIFVLAAAVGCTTRTEVATTVPPERAATPTTKASAQPATVAEYLASAKQLRVSYSKPSSEWPKPTLSAGVEHRELGLLAPPTFPQDNAYSKEKEALGRQLFFDPRLSGSGDIACASCHDPDLAWADGRTVSFGHRRSALKRNAPSVQFSAYASSLFWDGRAASLEDQFHGPVASTQEMNGDGDVIAKRLNEVPQYREQFRAVFGTDQVTMDNAAKAVATFERSLARMAGRSKFDQFLAGDTKALSDAQIRGLHIFRTSARCMNCHNGPEFSDNQFHDLGLSYYGRKLQDLGRYDVTHAPQDVGRFRTPTLRNVARTRPYAHNGVFDLAGFINAYNAGMPSLTPEPPQKDDPLFPRKDPLLKPLGLGSLEREDLIAFIESLNEPLLRMRPPVLPLSNAIETSSKSDFR